MIIAPLYVRLENVASWHMSKAWNASKAKDEASAERHERIAFVLFRLAQRGRLRWRVS